ncbi:LysR family transcriptional regulator [Pseudoduganella sp. R-43]|uniref:LysR family transcriptional regulator n=1 Tax=unclassified Pseudoduganella TaxID=2637179 RepID=UPI003CE837AC
MLDDLALFIAIVEAGSLNAAAEKEGLPTATVTRRLQKLEAALGYRLLHRSARRTQPTAEGMQYYEQCRPLVQSLRQATLRLDATLGAIEGTIRVLAPVNFASEILAPAWASFLEQYPKVRLELELSNEVQDIVGTGADLAIRIGALADSTLTQRKLGNVNLVLAASPAYLAQFGTPSDVAELERHSTIATLPLREWHLQDPVTGAHSVLHPEPRVRVNEVRLAVMMAEAGLGIVLAPELQCHASLESGALVRLLPGWTSRERSVYAVWSQQRYLPARVRALLEHLAAFTAQHPLLTGEK